MRKWYVLAPSSDGRKGAELQAVLKEENKGGVPSSNPLQILSWKQRMNAAVLGSGLKHTKHRIGKNRKLEVIT